MSQKKLSDNQEIRTPEPPDENAFAIIDAFAVKENDSKKTPNDISLHGTVSMLSLDKNVGLVFATIIVGGHPFTVGLTDQQLETRAIYPGKTILVHYDLDDVKWV